MRDPLLVFPFRSAADESGSRSDTGKNRPGVSAGPGDQYFVQQGDHDLSRPEINSLSKRIADMLPGIYSPGRFGAAGSHRRNDQHLFCENWRVVRENAAGRNRARACFASWRRFRQKPGSGWNFVAINGRNNWFSATLPMNPSLSHPMGEGKVLAPFGGLQIQTQ